MLRIREGTCLAPIGQVDSTRSNSRLGLHTHTPYLSDPDPEHSLHAPHAPHKHSAIEGGADTAAATGLAAGGSGSRRRPHGLIGAGGGNNYTRNKRVEQEQKLAAPSGAGSVAPIFSPPRPGEDGSSRPSSLIRAASPQMVAAALSSPTSPGSPLSGGGGGGAGPMTLYNFPQLTEREKEHWKVRWIRGVLERVGG